MWTYPHYAYLDAALIALATAIFLATAAGLIAWALRPKAGA